MKIRFCCIFLLVFGSFSSLSYADKEKGNPVKVEPLSLARDVVIQRLKAGDFAAADSETEKIIKEFSSHPAFQPAFCLL